MTPKSLLRLISAIFLRGKGKIYKFLRGVLYQHFDLFFLGVKILLTSSIGGGGGGGGWILNGMAQCGLLKPVRVNGNDATTKSEVFTTERLYIARGFTI